MKIENWALHYINNFDFSKGILSGQIYGSTKYKDGSWIRTSRIQKVEGRFVYTLNSVYELGEPSDDYVEWCKDEGTYVPTEEEPIRWRSHDSY